MNITINKHEIKEDTYSIHFNGLRAHEMDKIRILLKTIFDYGQFDDHEHLSSQLGLKTVIEQVTRG